MAGEPDGTLADWRDIATSHKWDSLLLGNGMSINIWEPFGYRKLYDRAKPGGLSAQDRKLFSSTPNFERVPADLLTAIRVNDAVGLETSPPFERYRKTISDTIDISGRLEASSLLFFDATSHPLGNPALAVAGNP